MKNLIKSDKFKSKYEYLIDNKYHDLTILEIYGYQQYTTKQGQTKNRAVAMCRCECGNKVPKRISELKAHLIKGCGCKTHLYKQKYKSKEMKNYNALWRRYKSKALKRNYKFELSLPDFINLTKQNCHYCGVIPSTKFTRKDLTESILYNGIDRKDNDKGYVKDNVLTCCGTCNFGKHKKSYDSFISYLDRVAEHRNSLNNSSS